MTGLTKKRLGQYFSGSKVSELLVSLCSLSGNETVIDPMSGKGDMLKAAIKYGVNPSNLWGIEIDKDAASVCIDKLGKGKVIVGDAFSVESYKSIELNSWDAVITNPPYVRYQSVNNEVGDGIMLKNALEIRNDLAQIVDILGHLTTDEKTCFLRIVKNYSGLSDLAVPAWILCAALVKQGGVLAMVVPESWMKRNYALSVKYLLLKMFDIEFIVEDLNAVWFPDALVKTNLVVARRSVLHDNPLSRFGERFLHLRLESKVMGESSLVENLRYNEKSGRDAVAELIQSAKNINGDGFELVHVDIADFISDMTATHGFNKVLSKLEANIKPIRHTTVPKEIRKAVGIRGDSLRTADLATWGFNVGQGLRTGANKFFYTELARADETTDFLIADNGLGKQIIGISRRHSIPALRYQGDAQNRYSIAKDAISHRLLYIDEQFFNNNGTLRDEMDKELADYITYANSLQMESDGKLTRFSELSAVKPNGRKNVMDGKVVQRHWFMLPTLAKRHLPQLCIARVNYKTARCLTVESGIVVDANFSTLWANSGTSRQAYAMLAIMNSSWVKTYLECIASVMGGGALKVEATHLRQLRLPIPTDNLVSSLSELGASLAKSSTENDGELIQSIDGLILGSILGIKNPQKQLDSLRELMQAKLSARKK
jgi:predicted RNA methylase